jgi:hypothetical protein
MGATHVNQPAIDSGRASSRLTASAGHSNQHCQSYVVVKQDIMQKWTNSDSCRTFCFEVPYKIPTTSNLSALCSHVASTQCAEVTRTNT